MPTNAKGVKITITVIDSNGNSQVLGTTISDLGGSYGLSWIPSNEGKYQIVATFAGTNSYGGSYATAYLTVGKASTIVVPIVTLTPTEAPTATPAPTTPVSASPTVAPTPDAGVSTETLLIAGTAIVIIIAVIAAALVLRKRK